MWWCTKRLSEIHVRLWYEFHIIARRDLTTAECESIRHLDSFIEIETINGTINTNEVVSLSLPGLWDHTVTAILVKESLR